MLYNPFNPNDLPFNTGNGGPNITDAEACIQDVANYEEEQNELDEKIQAQHDMYDALKEQQEIDGGALC
jgi:phosphoglucomutase